MKNTKYLIIGGGMSADSAVRGIRSMDLEGTICMVSNEPVGPYNRPPLSKGLWKGKPLEKIWRRTDKQNVDQILSTVVTKLDPANKTAFTNDGEKIKFEKALISTGATPRRFPFSEVEVNYFRYLSDYQSLKEKTESGKDFVIIGGGFIGSELAASLADLEKNVRIIFPEKWLNQRIFPAEISAHLHEVFEQHGVEIITGISVLGIDGNEQKKTVHIQDEKAKLIDLQADGVIAGLGVIPNISIAQDANLPVENGIKVDSHFKTEHPDIYASGDVAYYPDPILKKYRRVEHEDHANSSGMFAGKNMAGANESYNYLPYFYSDLFDIGYEAVGELDSSLGVTIDWLEPFQKGVFYYQRDSRVVGVLLWNIWGKLDAARAIIAENREMSTSDLPGLIK